MKALAITTMLIFCSVTAIADLDPGRYEPLIGTSWYGIYMQDSKIGYATMSLSHIVSGDWKYDSNLHLQLEANQRVITITSLDSRTYSGKDGGLIANASETNSGGMVVKVDGELRAGSYELVMDIMGQQSTKSFRPPVEKLPDILAVQLMARTGDLKPNTQFIQNVFVPDPSVMDTMTHIIKFTGQQEIYQGGISSKVYVFRDSIPAMHIGGGSYVDQTGQIIKQDFPSMQYVLKLEPEEMAKSPATGFDVLRDSIIKTKGGLVNPTKVNHAEYIISGFNVEDLPQSWRTQVIPYSADSAGVTIDRHKIDGSDLSLPITDPELQPYLKPEPLIQSDNEEIKALANNIAGSERNVYRATILINRWVFDNIRTEFSPDISNAYQTLKAGRGDCGEHTALAVALLRAAGIPARGLGGIAYVPALGGFGYHAWVEVYVGQWIQIDPTWGEDNADAMHIPLGRGNLKEMIVAVLGSMNKISIEIIEYN